MQQITIIRKGDSGSGIPSKTLTNTGNNSDQDPAGKRYNITFLKLSNTSRPFSIATTIDAKLLSSKTIFPAAIAKSDPEPMAIPIFACLLTKSSKRFFRKERYSFWFDWKELTINEKSCGCGIYSNAVMEHSISSSRFKM